MKLMVKVGKLFFWWKEGEELDLCSWALMSTEFSEARLV